MGSGRNVGGLRRRARAYAEGLEKSSTEASGAGRKGPCSAGAKPRLDVAGRVKVPEAKALAQGAAELNHRAQH